MVKKPQEIFVDLPTHLLSQILVIAEEEQRTMIEVILDLLQSAVSHASEVRLQAKKGSHYSETDDSALPPQRPFP